MTERWARWLRIDRESRALGRLVGHLRVPLYGGAYALILSSTTTSALGIVYWTLAARLCGTVDVGVNAAAISAMAFLSYLAQLNLAGALTRFVPTAGKATSRLVISAYTVAALASAVAGLVFVLGVGIWAPNIRPIVENPLLAAWFVLATIAWSLFTLQDGVLTGLRRTVWVPVENTLFAIAKIALLVVFAGTVVNVGVFASWTIPAALAVIPVNALIFGRFIAAHVAKSSAAQPEGTPRQIVRYLSADYAGSLLVSAAIGLLPLIVLSVIGPSGSAYFYMAWTIAYSLQMISVNMAMSLTVEGAARQHEVVHSLRRMLRLLVRLQIPLVAVVIVAAPLVLQLFGRAYADEATTLLRILAIGVLPHGINAIFLSLARIRRQIGWLVAVQASQAALFVTFSLLLLGPLGITGVGVAFLIAQSLVAAVVVVTRIRPLLQSGDKSVRIEVSFPPAADDLAALPDTVALAAGADGRSLRDRTFDELTRTGVAWVLLRPDLNAEAGDDVDVLVAPADYGMTRTVLREMGFLQLPGRGRGSHRFFLGHDPQLGEWLRLDLVTELAYGRWFEFRTGLGADCLGRRSGSPTSQMMDRDDELYALLLHCILDKGFVSPKRGGQLQQLVLTARAPGPLHRMVARLLPSDWTAERAERAVRDGDWPALASLGRRVSRRWRRRDPIGTTTRTLSRAIVRLLEPLLLFGRPGMTVALLGPDGTGKSTLSDRIKSDMWLPVRCIYMGMWQDRPSRFRRSAGALEIGLRPLRIWGRYLKAVANRRLGRVVVFDRYTRDAMLPPRGRLVALKRVYFWFLARCIPAPDLLVVLDAPGDLLFARKGESDPVSLEEDRQHFRALAHQMRNAVIVDASAPADVVYRNVDRLLWEHLTGQARGQSSRRRLGRIRALAGRGGEMAMYSAGLAGRQVGNQRRKGQASGAIDLVLADLRAQSLIPASWCAGRLSVTDTGIGLIRIGPSNGLPLQVVKVALSEGSREALQTHLQVVTQLSADPRLTGWSRLLPVVRGTGHVGKLGYLAEDLLPGRQASSLLKCPDGPAALRAAALAIVGLHEATREQLRVDQTLIDNWVLHPMRAVCAALPASPGSDWRADALGRIATRASSALYGRDVQVSWIHGDYWPGNVLVTDDGSRVTGLVDWDLAGPRLPPLHDAIDLVLFARRIRQRRDIGSLACAMLEDPHLDPAEEDVVRIVGLGWPSDAPGLRLAIVLAWLRHIGSVARVSGHAGNPWWVRRNLDPLLRSTIPSLTDD